MLRSSSIGDFCENTKEPRAPKQSLGDFRENTKGTTWDGKSFGKLCMNASNSNLSFILTELVIDLNAEKGDISFVILCGFSYEIAKSAT